MISNIIKGLITQTEDLLHSIKVPDPNVISNDITLHIMDKYNTMICRNICSLEKLFHMPYNDRGDVSVRVQLDQLMKSLEECMIKYPGVANILRDEYNITLVEEEEYVTDNSNS